MGNGGECGGLDASEESEERAGAAEGKGDAPKLAQLSVDFSSGVGESCCPLDCAGPQHHRDGPLLVERGRPGGGRHNIARALLQRRHFAASGSAPQKHHMGLGDGGHCGGPGEGADVVQVTSNIPHRRRHCLTPKIRRSLEFDLRSSLRLFRDKGNCS